jgi:hypothetical protein
MIDFSQIKFSTRKALVSHLVLHMVVNELFFSLSFAIVMVMGVSWIVFDSQKSTSRRSS